MKIQLTDKVSHKVTSSRLYDENNFLRVPAKVARTGIQEYLARELGLTDRAPGDVVKVYRPPEEVFATDSLASYKDVDITVDHPVDLVSSKTFDKVSVGHVTSEGRQEGDWVVCDLIIKSQDAIDNVEKGLVEVSMGYSMDLVPKEGMTTDGVKYEFIQTNLTMNHVALVQTARAGAQARIADKGTKTMPRVKLLDGTAVTVEDENTAMLIQQSFDSVAQKLEDSEKRCSQLTDNAEKLEVALQMADEEKTEFKSKLEEEKKHSADSVIASRAAALVDARAKAKLIAGDSFACDSVNVADVQRASLTSAYPSIAWDDKSADVLAFAFDMYAKKKEDEMLEEEEDKKKSKESHDSLAQNLLDADSKVVSSDPQAIRDAAYEEYMDNIGK